MILNLLARFWYAPVILILLALLAFSQSALGKCKAQRELANSKLAVSNASIERLDGDLNVVLRAQQALSEADKARIEGSKDRLALIDAAEKARQGAVEKLLQSAEHGKAECDFSDTIKEMWK